MSDESGDTPPTRQPQRLKRGFKFASYLFARVEVSAAFVILLLCFAACAEAQQAAATATTTNNSPPTPEANKTAGNATSPKQASEDEAPPKVLLVSGDEFVDANEAPTLLFDNVESNETSSVAPQTTDKTTASGETTTAAATAAPPPTTRPAVAGETGDDSDADAADGDYEALPEQSFALPQNISQYMDYIETLFHDLRHQITDLFEPHLPQLIRTSQMVALSSSCSYDMLRLALALRQFEPWALQMIDSSGKLPEGILEGSFTALGSYDQCLGVVFASTAAGGTTTRDDAASKSTRGKYCLVTVSPFLPPKPPADKVERLFQDEANKRNYTKDDQFSRISPMFYYMKFRIGVCIPSTCEQDDVESISNALSSSLRLNITIPDCRIKQVMPLTGDQLVGGLVFASVLALIFLATLLDWWRRKWLAIQQQELRALGGGSCLSSRELSCDKSSAAATVISMRTNSKCTRPQRYFDRMIGKHWTWMSFSLITNFKLYFRQRPAALRPDRTECTTGASQARPQALKCLNGIRVLSLCWIIIANSYITLDPRATKRLSKTREAPKDFLFQLVVQASLAIETFFFLSGLLLSLSYFRKFNASKELDDEPNSSKKREHQISGDKVARKESSQALKWIHFYVHRYVRLTPATMLVIALSMYAYHFGDGPLWFEATQKAHQSCAQNWWRHLLHVANFIDTRQMCFIHYWYISADMQLFLFAPILLYLLNRYTKLGSAIISSIGFASIWFVFKTTYERNLPPTLLFYNSDPESRREFGNTIMTKPLTHALPYLVGMLVGKWITSTSAYLPAEESSPGLFGGGCRCGQAVAGAETGGGFGRRTLAALMSSAALAVALGELFLPYKWNNSHLPTKLMAATYAALFRFGWSLVLAYVVVSCRHRRGESCSGAAAAKCHLHCERADLVAGRQKVSPAEGKRQAHSWKQFGGCVCGSACGGAALPPPPPRAEMCFCGTGGNLVNRLLGLDVFAHLNKLSFVAYLIHLPLMSVFIGQTRGLFAFSHTLVMHLALSYLVLTVIFSFVLVHIIEFPFVTFERYLFERLFNVGGGGGCKSPSRPQTRDEQLAAESSSRKEQLAKVRPETALASFARRQVPPATAAAPTHQQVAPSESKPAGDDSSSKL